MKREDGWGPIATAPKDGAREWDNPTIELGFADGTTAYGRFNPDTGATRPRPFWDWERGGTRVTEHRAKQPLIWRPLPSPSLITALCEAEWIITNE